MTTVVVVRKGGTVAIASDSLVTFGDTRLDASYEANDKLFKVGGSWIGMSGTTAHFPVLRRALATLPADELKLNSRDEVFDTFLKLHPKLKETYFLNPKEEDADPYESSQFTALIANAAGIFGVYSYREVFEFDRFWSVGTGRSFALGAMYASYDKAKSARELAELGVRAGCEFDKNSSGPVRAHTIKLKTKD
jgi:ATP-dependent HslUV protease, peptidase subunit HslV